MNTDRPISEDDLHAYVDDALDPERRADLEAYLAANPDASRLVERFAAQRAMLRDVLGPIAAEPVPPQLALGSLIGTPAYVSRRPWLSAAAAVLLLVAGGAMGWIGHGMMPAAGGSGVAAVAQEALSSFDVYGADPVRPVEIKAVDRADLLKWLSRRLGRSIAAPDLSASGYHFLGGRLVATVHGPAGLFMYDNDAGDRLVMLVRPMAVAMNAPMSEHADGRAAGFAWAENGLGYSLVGAIPPRTLHPLANEIRRQVRSAT